MGHPVAEFRTEVAELKQQIAELQARLGIVPGVAPEPTREAGMPRNAFRDQFGMIRNSATGEVLKPQEDDEQANARKRADWAAHDAKVAAERAAMTAGLPAGMYRDPCGLIRMIDTGKVVSAAAAEAVERQAVEKEQASLHRNWKEGQNLPVHPLPLPEDAADED